MIDPAIIPCDELQRIQALRRYEILDTPPDGAFDNVTKLAARLFGVPISIISLVDTDRIWFKSHHGVDAEQIDRVPGLCASGILGKEAYVLTNAIEDPRSLTNPLVAGEFGLRFYAGVPLQTHDNYNLGMLCCLDFAPRMVTPGEIEDLKCLGQLVMDQMELRRAAREVDELRQQMAQTKERMSLAIRAGKIGVWGLDLAGEHFEWDEQMHALYGQSPQHFQATPQAWLDLVHPDDRQRVEASWQSTVSGASSFESEFRVRLPDGETRYLRGLAQAYRDAAGKSQRILGINWDVTRERLASEALRQAKERAEAAERAKSNFLASMSHELRTPLNAIIGFGEVLKHDVSLSSQNTEYIQIINQSGSHLLALINEVLDLAKVESNRIELLEKSFDLPGLLETVSAMLAMRAESKDLRLFRDFSELPRFVRADEMKIRQILLNLLSNAVKFTRKGEVKLSAAFDDRGAGRGELRIEVSDSGPGIAPDELASLFTPFQQGQAGRQLQEGTGLGLVLSKKFVELMGGDMSVRSTLGKGSTFAFSIPVSVSEDGETAEFMGEVIGLEGVQAPLRMLVVDDIPFNRLLLERRMLALGFAVETAANGREAVEKFVASRPDLIWMDLVMPEMDGWAATRQIRRMPGGDAVRIVCVTASALAEDRNTILANGFDDVLFKPLREQKLFGLLQKMMGVRFIFRDHDSSNRAPTDESQLFAGLDGLRLPADWLGAFHSAALNGDTEAMQQQIDLLATRNQERASQLQNLLDDLQLETLEKLAHHALTDQTG